MYFKNLYLKKSGKLYKGEYLDSPVSYSEFKETVKDIPNLNINYIKEFYSKYVNSLFPNIISKDYKLYSKYFWRFECLGLTATSSSNDEYWLERGWNSEQIKEKKKERFSTNSLQYYLDLGYTEKEAKDLYKRRKIKQAEKANQTKEETGNKGGYSLEKFIESGLSEKEAQEKLNSIIESKSSSMKKVWSETNSYENRLLPQNIEYWLEKGYSEKEAKEKVSERQRTFTLEKCIEKYGEIEGKKRFKQRQKKWKNSLHKNFEKCGDSRSPQSQWSTKIINSICKELNIEIPKKEKWIKNQNKAYSYDFCLRDKRKIIEFHGDYWHCNPDIYNSNYYNSSIGMTAQEKWNYDKEKIKTTELNNYEVLIVWENEENILFKCLNFLRS